MGGDVVLVTGGAGYIGSHLAWALHDQGRPAVVLDSGVNSGARVLPAATPVIRADAGDRTALETIIRDHGVTQVAHLAASISVPASVADPEGYRRNNLQVTENLAAACRATGVARVVFASTAAVYGDFPEGVASETSPTRPTNPYGATKLAAEAALHAAGGFQPVILRFFNASGADALARSGPDPAHSASLFINAVETALGRRDCLEIYGTDHPTRDGSAERDYIHIDDLTAVLREILAAPPDRAFPPAMNLGYGHGYTVLEVVETLERLIGRSLEKRFLPPGPAIPPASSPTPPSPPAPSPGAPATTTWKTCCGQRCGGGNGFNPNPNRHPGRRKATIRDPERPCRTPNAKTRKVPWVPALRSWRSLAGMTVVI